MAAHAGLYQLPDSVIVYKDDRASKRHSVHAMILVAPIYDGEVKDFAAGITRDISTSGISFYLRNKPTTKHVVVDLCRRNVPLILLCRIVRSEVATNTISQAYIVGCEFIEVWNAMASLPGKDTGL